MKVSVKLLLKAGLFIAYGLVLGALVIASAVQGVLSQLNGNLPVAVMFYILALLSAAASMGNYYEARKKARLAEIFQWK